MNQTNYYYQIDSLRCYAAIAVLFSHFFNPQITKHLYIGVAGVDLFFVISGFLITEMLIKYKNQGASLKNKLKTFYLRRAIRIFPIYYLYLFISFIVNENKTSESLPFAIFYCMNFYQLSYDVPSVFQHLWSLSIEEQFYLFWPIIVLTIPQRHLLKYILVAILIAVVPRFLFPFINHKLLTSSCFDAFGLGSLFAYLKIYNPSILKKILKQNWILAIVIVEYVVTVLFSVAGINFLHEIFRLNISILSFFLLGFALPQVKDIVIKEKQVLLNKNSIFLGKISYGIYMYHLLIAYLLTPALNEFLSDYCAEEPFFLKYLYYNSYIIKFPLYTLFSIAIAFISFKYIESPINKMKSKFNI